MSRIYILFLFILIIGGEIHAQSWWYQPKQDSNTQVTYVNDARIDSLLSRKVLQNQSDSTSPGFRVQIFYGSKRDGAMEIKEQFAADFPSQPVYIIYDQPYFKVRMGDFRDRHAAEKWARRLGQKYHGSFIIEDRINYW